MRLLAWNVGGPIDGFFETMSQRVKRMPGDGAALVEITSRFGAEMIGVPA